jgi:hypothetical protein
MRRYFASIVITIVLGSVAVWQVTWHRDWVLVAWIVVCVGFNWWWTFQSRSPRLPLIPTYATGWPAFLESLCGGRLDRRADHPSGGSWSTADRTARNRPALSRAAVSVTRTAPPCSRVFAARLRLYSPVR